MTEHGGLILAIDAGGTFFKSGLVTADGEIPVHTRISCPVDSAGQADSVRWAYQSLIGRQLENARALGQAIKAVGVDTPGPFDYREGKSLMRHKFRALYGIPLRPWIQEAAGKLPVRFLHDSTAFLLGEYWKGGLQGEGNAAGVMLGTGLGFAFMQNGAVQLNFQDGPGFSLYTVPYREGIAEDYVSRRGIISRYLERVPQAESGIDVADIARLARRGSAPALATMKETGRMLGEILLPVLKEKQCRRLAVGGQISKAYPLFGPDLEKVLEDIRLDSVAPAKSPDGAHLLGCAYLLLKAK